MFQHPPIGPLRRFWALGEERIILASALMADLRKCTNGQRLGLSTCNRRSTTELRPQVLPQVGDERGGRNYALSFEGPESP